MSDKDQKTQAPTAKKLDDARQKGDVASAAELRHAIMFGAALVIVMGIGASTLAQLTPLLTSLWGSAEDYQLDAAGARSLSVGVLKAMAVGMLPIAALLVAAAALTVFGNGRPSIAWARLAIKWSKLSPKSSLGRLFGTRAIIDFAKTLLKLIAVISIATIVVWPKAVGLTQLMGAEPVMIGTAATELVVGMVKAITLLVAALALFDFVYQRFAYHKRMMMTLQEVKDEHKQSDGNPEIKARMRRIGLVRSRQRMMAAVPEASVIITNPTHYAIALKYDHGAMSAPVVVAKGMDAIALNIRRVATEAGVPIVESPALARAIYATVAVDRTIPVEHYAAVAEIIGYVMRLARRR